MNHQRDEIIRAAAAASGLSKAFAVHLIEEAPWLDGDEEVGSSIGTDLLAADACAFGLDFHQLTRFIDVYNEQVQRANNPLAERQSEAYGEISQILAAFGREDAFGDGDHWIVSDSFSTRSPVVVVCGAFRLPVAAISKLQGLLNRYRDTFEELRVCTEEGASVLTLRSK